MKSSRFVRIAAFTLLFLLNGCARTEETASEVVELDITSKSETAELDIAAGVEGSGVDSVVESETSEEDTAIESSVVDSALKADKVEAEDLLDAFLANEIPAISDEDSSVVIMFSDLPTDEEDFDFSNYSVGERVDLDNDGENEQIIDGPYGGLYLDARDEKVYILARGEGTAGELFYTNYNNAVWIVHCDITHVGRQMYWLTRYDGEGNIVDEFQFSAEYWDYPSGSQYDENSDFTFRDQKISMEEYEALGKEIFGW